MTTLREWAELYKSLRVWVCPYTDYNERKSWLYWRNMKAQDYDKEFETYDWESAKGIDLITGKNGIVSLYIDKDENKYYAQNSLNKVLKILGLPQHYEWIIEENTFYLIILDVYGIPSGNFRKKYNHFSIHYEIMHLLPPGTDQYKYWFPQIPSSHPIQIYWDNFQNCIAEINKLDIVDDPYSKNEGKTQMKTSVKVGIGCVTFIVMAIALSTLGLMDTSEHVGAGMAFVGILIVIGLAAVGIYFTKDT